MSRVSPTLEGFRAALRRPSLTFAEIAWRWTAGALAWALSLFWFIEYLDTLPVSNTDATLLSTRQPLLVGRAIAHILRGSLNRAVLAVLLAVIALSLLWIVAASIGRAATVRALFDYFRSGVASNVSTTYDAIKSLPLRSLIGLNFLRVAVVLASFLAFGGAAILAGFASPDRNPQPGLAFVLFLPLAGLICMVCWALNWLLSMASIFAVRDGEGVLSALSATVTFSRERSGPVLAVSTWTGLAHLVAFSVATSAVSLPLAFLQIAPTRLIIATVVLGTLAYFAVVDWLYMARLAGYISIAEMPEALASSVSLSAPPPTGQQFAPSPAQTTIDRDESILSDIPIPDLETLET
ncbi:MAG: hypothetical protein WCA20_05105 [Candidatus Sulfotelmatobacter sp.]